MWKKKEKKEQSRFKKIMKRVGLVLLGIFALFVVLIIVAVNSPIDEEVAEEPTVEIEETDIPVDTAEDVEEVIEETEEVIEEEVIVEETFPTEKDTDYIDLLEEHATLQAEILIGMSDSIGYGDIDGAVEYADLLEESCVMFLDNTQDIELSSELRELENCYRNAMESYRQGADLFIEGVYAEDGDLIDSASSKLVDGTEWIDLAITEIGNLVD